MLNFDFDNSYARLPEALFHRQSPCQVPAPSMIAWNAPLARSLNITGGPDAQTLSGNLLPKGAEPLAQLYSGHQFGHWNSQLGDGRALLLGEVIGAQGRRDIVLKGSGRTPYSRGGDGRAALGPVLREYLVSESMHALNIPTTRALAAIRSGDDVIRDTPLPGAILTRIAASHIRVGTFQVLAARGMKPELNALFEHVITRHYPGAQTPVDLLRQVCKAQADLVARWMAVGFVHGVMNTDNCAISGETLDYGPCAFLEEYRASAVFSSIDRQGRYAYGAQADVILWNMAQLASALLALMPDSDETITAMTQVIQEMEDVLRSRWRAHFGAKIGIREARPDDAALMTGLLGMMEETGADFTNSFRALADGTSQALSAHPRFAGWERDWRKRLEAEPDDPLDLMARVNPAIIARNHLVEEAIQAAQKGDDAPFHRLNKALTRPFDPDDDDLPLTRPAKPDQRVHATFCGT